MAGRTLIASGNHIVFAVSLSSKLTSFLHFRGEVSAVVNQVTMKMQIKQMIQNTPPPELLGESISFISIWPFS